MCCLINFGDILAILHQNFGVIARGGRLTNTPMKNIGIMLLGCLMQTSAHASGNPDEFHTLAISVWIWNAILILCTYKMASKPPLIVPLLLGASAFFSTSLRTARPIQREPSC